MNRVRVKCKVIKCGFNHNSLCTASIIYMNENKECQEFYIEGKSDNNETCCKGAK